MRIDTPEKYKALQERRRQRRSSSRTSVVPARLPLDHGFKPNHKLRAVSIGTITEAILRPKAEKKSEEDDEG